MKQSEMRIIVNRYTRAVTLYEQVANGENRTEFIEAQKELNRAIQELFLEIERLRLKLDERGSK